jgi:hypothetical protein
MVFADLPSTGLVFLFLGIEDYFFIQELLQDFDLRRR